MSGAVRVRVYPMRPYQGKYYAFFINGVYEGFNRYADAGQVLEAVIPLDPGTTVASVYVEDAGKWAAFEDGFTPSGQAELNDATSAQRLQFNWTAPYTLTSVRGDTQITGITVTGAQRGVNVGRTNRPTRGKLSYQIITTADGDYIVRWWADELMVAEGYRTGNGALTCSAVNDSGLSVDCTLTYTADLTPYTAFVELRWPGSYAIHYSTSALSFPRTAEATVNDNGDLEFSYLTAVLSSGAYNWNILTVDDDGVTQTGSFITTSALTINTTPAKPTITSVTGTAAELTVNWTVGESGCTFTAYSSLINHPTNYGQYSNPAPVVTATDATSAILPAAANYPGIVRCVVRATKTGNQETTDAVYEVELDSTGAIVAKRPNRAGIYAVAITGGLTLAVEGVVVEDDAEAPATDRDLYLVALASAIDTTASATATATLSAASLGVKRATISYAVASGGWYRMAVLARSAGGSRSRTYTEYIIYIDNTAPGAVLNASAKVIRGS